MGNRVRLPNDPASVARARAFAGEVYAAAGLDVEIADVGRLVISELVTNAIVHSASEVEVGVWVEAGATGGEVVDFGTGQPQLLAAPLLAVGGRGLGIVAATTSAWGVRVHEHGKTVWFELPRTPAAETAAAEVPVEAMHDELRARVLAATAHADYRRIGCRPTPDARDEYEVHALAGDRLVHMVLSLRHDGSVAEHTETFLPDQVFEVTTLPTGRLAVEVGSGTGRRWLSIPDDLADRLRSRSAGATRR